MAPGARSQDETAGAGVSPRPLPGTAMPGCSQPVQELRAILPPGLHGSVHRATELRRRQRGSLREQRLPTMVPALDELLGGGLPRGAMVELVGRRSSGRFAMLLAALAAVTDTGAVAALVDLGHHLDPQAAATAGVELARLLWLQPQRLPDALSAAELLVNTGFPLVVVDLGLPPVRGRVSQAAWLRLARSSLTHCNAVLVGSPYRLSGCAAVAVVVAGQRRGVWSLAGSSAQMPAPRLLHGLVARLSTARRRGHRPGASRETTLLLAETVAPAAGINAPGHRRPAARLTTVEVPYAEAR